MVVTFNVRNEVEYKTERSTQVISIFLLVNYLIMLISVFKTVIFEFQYFIH